MIRFILIVAYLIQALSAQPAVGHELRPAYLDMRETAADQFAVVWKVPALGDRRLSLYVRLPDACKSKTEPVGSIEAGAYFERWSINCAGGIKGKEMAIEGLRSTLTDVLVRIEHQGGSMQIARLTPETPQFVASGVQSGLEVAQTYFLLGVDHILTGLDHLLFVVALMLLIPDRWMLVKTITAFTVAHSITLAGATFGYLSLPQAPVEATIALSIAFVASELAKVRPGERRLSESYPWLVAFAFGLLHGFGFAGALKEIGLPQTDVPLALLTFNLGVEAGQLIFVAAVLLGVRAATSLYEIPVVGARVAAYVIGTISAAWLISRVSAF
ncbi:MAG: HupE/UreJ family protein [Hyphomicrobiaceae bacterium]